MHLSCCLAVHSLAESVTDVRKIFLPLCSLALLLLLTACITSPPISGGDSTDQGETKTEQTTEHATNSQTESKTEHAPDTEQQTSTQGSDAATDQTTQPITQNTAEEQTTYGELHFPESGE